jgi:hypothetical protein
MKKTSVVIAALFFSVCLCAGAFAQEKKADGLKKDATTEQKPKTVKERTVVKTAIVEAIDMKTRLVSLKDKDGNLFDLKISEAVKNLPQVKVGDQVTATYYESIAFELADPGTPLQAGASESAAKAKLGERPSGAKANILSVVVNIEAIDSKKNVATLRGPEGKIVKVKILDPKKWQSAKVGDKLRVTYTEEVAVKVTKVEKK